MVSCCVFGCANTNKITGIKLFSIPKPKKNCISLQKNKLLVKQNKAWFHSVSRKDLKLTDFITKDIRICSKHFISGKPAAADDVNNPDWLPSLDMGKTERKHINDTTTNSCNLRHSRYENRQRQMNATFSDTESNTSSEYVSASASSSSSVLPDISLLSVETETNISTNNPVDNDRSGVHNNAVNNDQEHNNAGIDVWAELQRRTEEVFVLREKILKLQLTETSFENNNDKLTFYTGLPSIGVFKLILGTIEDSLTMLKFESLDNFQKLLITLMKLRTNASFKDLGFRFGIEPRTVSNVFKKTIILLSFALDEFIVWPTREAAKVLMPACFQRSFGNSITVIVDCFEISTQKPSTLRAKVQCFSQYKQRTTVKYLIGITPHGVISFISRGYGGRVSDKAITQTCGILKNLLPGDVVMADRGFTIDELVAEKGARVKIPDFTKGKTQLHPKAVGNTREIAAVRIHVERIIGEIRNKYMILNGPIPITLLRNRYKNKRLLDYIVRVCCILTNFCDSIVPIDK